MYIGVIAGKSGNAIVSELHKHGCKVALVCGKVNEAGYDLADMSMVEDLKNKENIVSFFKDNDIDKVIIATGHILAIELAEFMVANGIKINIDINAVKLCKDKYLTKKVLRNGGLPVLDDVLITKSLIEQGHLDEKINCIGLPCVIKSIRDIKEPQLYSDKENLETEILDMLLKKDEIFLEKYVEGSDCTVVVSRKGNEINPLGCVYWSKGKEDRLKGFENSKTVKLDEEVEARVLAIAQKAVEITGVAGVTRVDFIVDNDKPYILEINGIIVSGLSGTSYCVKIMQKGINRARGIVEGALKSFNIKTTRKEIIGVFYDCDKMEHLKEGKDYELKPVLLNEISKPKGTVYPDLAENFKEYLNLRNIKDIDISKALDLLLVLIEWNFDAIINDLVGEYKAYIDILSEYLNIPTLDKRDYYGE